MNNICDNIYSSIMVLAPYKIGNAMEPTESMLDDPLDELNASDDSSTRGTILKPNPLEKPSDIGKPSIIGKPSTMGKPSALGTTGASKIKKKQFADDGKVNPLALGKAVANVLNNLNSTEKQSNILGQCNNMAPQAPMAQNPYIVYHPNPNMAMAQNSNMVYQANPNMAMAQNSNMVYHPNPNMAMAQNSNMVYHPNPNYQQSTQQMQAPGNMHTNHGPQQHVQLPIYNNQVPSQYANQAPCNMQHGNSGTPECMHRAILNMNTNRNNGQVLLYNSQTRQFVVMKPVYPVNVPSPSSNTVNTPIAPPSQVPSLVPSQVAVPEPQQMKTTELRLVSNHVVDRDGAIIPIAKNRILSTGSFYKLKNKPYSTKEL